MDTYSQHSAKKSWINTFDKLGEMTLEMDVLKKEITKLETKYKTLSIKHRNTYNDLWKKIIEKYDLDAEKYFLHYNEKEGTIDVMGKK